MAAGCVFLAPVQVEVADKELFHVEQVALRFTFARTVSPKRAWRFSTTLCGRSGVFDKGMANLERSAASQIGLGEVTATSAAGGEDRLNSHRQG